MLRVAGYTIDRIVNTTEQSDGVALHLESSGLCVIPSLDPRKETLLSWANLCMAFEMALALRITDGVVRDAANHAYLVVRSLRQRDADTLDVWLEGRGGQYSYSLKNPDAEDHSALLLHSQQTKRPLFLLIHVSLIEVVVDLSPEQFEAIVALGIPTGVAREEIAVAANGSI